MSFSTNKYSFILRLFICFGLAFSAKEATGQKAVNKEHGDIALKNAFGGKFFIGTALNTWQLKGKEPEAIEIAQSRQQKKYKEILQKEGL